LAEAHLARGVVHLFGYELRDAEMELERARELDPGISGVAGYLSAVYRWTGRSPDALAETRRESRDEPLSAAATAELSHALYFVGDYDQAHAEIDKVMALRPPLRRAFPYRAEIFLGQRRWRDAVAALRPPVPQGPRVRAMLGYALGRSGQRTEAMQVLERLRAGVATGEGSAYAVALVYAGLGDFDHAYEWLDRAIDEYTIGAALMGPAFADLRADPRFAGIRSRLGLDRR
jgi:tetratricopeptide (TPR) repeat protein